MQKDESNPKNIKLYDCINQQHINVPTINGANSLEQTITKQDDGPHYVPLAEEVLAQVQHAFLVHKTIFKKDDDFYTPLFSEAVMQLQEHIETISKEIKPKWWSIAETNQHLDNQRQQLTSTMHTFVANIGIKPTTDKENQWQKLWRKLPAHNHRIINYNEATDRKTVIAAAPENLTAHNKSDWGDNCAQRKIEYYQGNEKIFEIIRVPSLANTKDEIDDDIINITNRIASIHENAGDTSKPIIYNLLTSLHNNIGLEKTFDDIKTKQNKSTARIFTAAHEYNYQTNKINHGFIFVQNLGVNGFSADLGHTSGIYRSEVVEEATIMADMAILATINKGKLPDTASEAYKTYLSNYPTKPLCKTKSGKQLANAIKAIKNSIKQGGQNHQDPLTASDILRIAYANNIHYKQEYGNIIQTISILAQNENSIQTCSGCKSANERFENIINQVYNAIDNKAISETSIRDLYENPEKALKTLSDKFNQAVNDAGGYTPNNSVSISDQSAGSKLKVARRGLYNGSKAGIVASLGLIIAGAITVNPIMIGAGLVIGVLCAFGLEKSGTNYASSNKLSNQSNNKVQQQHNKQFSPKTSKSATIAAKTSHPPPRPAQDLRGNIKASKSTSTKMDFDSTNDQQIRLN